ncbi:amidase family protein [Pararhodobacter zhoushanensis]|uniref:Amidase family protein n=1 Tax=Pararhodobacter zhoushanensis TaxID=2479545 RepID=A0ABT3H4C6_9RHOB|nr:amidase family protein [Pararhodobacter zhoushanensis]MCW1934600.1 amidase family protein [Pararhodobacter zhoushanensis]
MTTDIPAYSGPDLCALSAVAVVDLLRRGDVSPEELIAASETRHAQTDPAVNAMPTTCFDRARKAARSLPAPSETRGALYGLPVGIKDLTAVEGVRTTWGTAALAEYVPEASDPLVERDRTTRGSCHRQDEHPGIRRRCQHLQRHLRRDPQPA